MGLAEDLIAAVEAGDGDAGKKAVVVEFLKGAGPVIDGLGEEAFGDLMRAVAGGEAAPAEVVEGMGEEEVVTGLGGVEQEMGAMAAEREAELAAQAGAVEALKAAALEVVARVVVGAMVGG